MVTYAMRNLVNEANEKDTFESTIEKLTKMKNTIKSAFPKPLLKSLEDETLFTTLITTYVLGISFQCDAELKLPEKTNVSAIDAAMQYGLYFEQVGNNQLHIVMGEWLADQPLVLSNTPMIFLFLTVLKISIN